jgi:hypothetical protein
VRAIPLGTFPPSRNAPPAVGLAIVALILLAPALTGCGKKDAPVPPPGAPSTYPLPYPRE